MRFLSKVLATTVRGPDEVRRRFFVGAALCLAAVFAGFIVMISSSTARAQPEEAEYSAYGDLRKPAVSFILSDPENVEEFQSKFGLSEMEVEAALAAVRAENEALAGTYAESEEVLEESRRLSITAKREKIANSRYDEEVQAAVGETKQRVEEELPEDRTDDLEAWVDEQWRQEVQEQNSEAEEGTFSTQARSSRGMTFKVYTTQYFGYTNFEMALPHRKLKFRGGYEAVVTNRGQSAAIPVREVGPWNTYDNYWDPVAKRTMWKNLPRGLPEAEAAFYNNYNKGRDEFGRKVLNPAGADLTPAAARQIGLKKYENAWVQVRMPWLKQ